MLGDAMDLTGGGCAQAHDLDLRRIVADPEHLGVQAVEVAGKRLDVGAAIEPADSKRKLEVPNLVWIPAVSAKADAGRDGTGPGASDELGAAVLEGGQRPIDGREVEPLGVGGLDGDRERRPEV